MIKREPSGYIATCKCGRTVGGIAIAKIDKSQVAMMLGEWILGGMKVEPKFGAFQVTLSSCKCRKQRS